MTACVISWPRIAKCRGPLSTLSLLRSRKILKRSLHPCTCPYLNRSWILKGRRKTSTLMLAQNKKLKLVGFLNKNQQGQSAPTRTHNVFYLTSNLYFEFLGLCTRYSLRSFSFHPPQINKERLRGGTSYKPWMLQDSCPRSSTGRSGNLHLHDWMLSVASTSTNHILRARYRTSRLGGMDGGLIVLMIGLVACSSWKVKGVYSFKMKPSYGQFKRLSRRAP